MLCSNLYSLGKSKGIWVHAWDFDLALQIVRETSDTLENEFATTNESVVNA